MHQVQRQKELNTATKSVDGFSSLDAAWDEKEAAKILEMQRQQIHELRAAIEVGVGLSLGLIS
jgi:hypothetical protein